MTDDEPTHERHDSSINPRWLDGLFLLVLTWHIIEYATDFSAEPSMIVLRVIVYAIISTIAIFLTKKAGHNMLPYLLFSLFLVIGYPTIKWGLSLLDSTVSQMTVLIGALMAILPVYAIFLYFRGVNYPFTNTDSKTGKEEFILMALLRNIYEFRITQWPKIWMFFLGFITILYLITSATTLFSGLPIAEQSDNFRVKDSIPYAIEFIETTVTDTWEKITSTGNYAINSTLNKLWAQTLGTQYSGQVEENTERTGVFINNFDRTGRYYEGIPVVFFPQINARSFSEVPVDLTFKCLAIPSGKNATPVEGFVEPKKLTIQNYDDQGIQCQFNHPDYPATALKPGSHRIEFIAEFNFETWAYTTYAFMERDFLNSLRTNGEDVNKKFDIPKKPAKTIYTAGPAMIGMNQEISLPVSLQTGIGKETNIPVGITLSNKQGMTGTIQNVNSFQLRVPQEFKINPGSCTRETGTPQIDQDTNYAVYTFQNPNPAELAQSFLTVDCNMKISGTEASEIIPEAGGVTGATIVGSAIYEYQLKKTISIRVEKNAVQ